LEEISVLAPLQGGWGAKWRRGENIGVEGQNGSGAKRTDGIKVSDKKLIRLVTSSKLIKFKIEPPH
jgi:hypothetical protein